MSEAAVAEYKCVVPRGPRLEGASLAVIAGLAGQLSRPQAMFYNELSARTRRVQHVSGFTR